MEKKKKSSDLVFSSFHFHFVRAFLREEREIGGRRKKSYGLRFDSDHTHR